MVGSYVRMALLAVRSYAARMLAAHASSYVLAALAALAVAALAPHGLSDPRAVPVTVAALAALVATFWATNYLAHRWALAAAAARLARDAEWTAEVVQRLLERATADDRRGTKAVGFVVDKLTASSPMSRLARFALRRVGASAVTRVAEVLAGAKAGEEPIATQVQRRVQLTLEGERRSRFVALVGLWGLVIAALAALRSGLVRL